MPLLIFRSDKSNIQLDGKIGLIYRVLYHIYLSKEIKELVTMKHASIFNLFSYISTTMSIYTIYITTLNYRLK